MPINPSLPLDTPQLYGDGLAEVRAEEPRLGVTLRKLPGLCWRSTVASAPKQPGRNGKRLAFTGSAQAIVDDIGAFARRGLEHFIIGGDGSDEASTIDRLEHFASEVTAKI